MKKAQLIYIIIAVVGTTLAVLFQEANLNFLEGSDMVVNGMVSTADEPSYFRPPINWLETGSWKDNSMGSSSYVQRPPGYGILFLLCNLISSSNPYVVLKIVQVLFFLITIVLVGQLVESLTKSRKLGYLAAIVFGCLPCFSGFTYYTLTESISPFLMVLFAFQFVMVLKTGKGYVWFSLINIVLLSVRPQLIVFSFLFSIVLMLNNKRSWHLILIGFIPMMLWQVRSFNISKEVSLHPIYSYSNSSIYRPPHASLTNLFRLWEYKGDCFHETIGLLIKDTTSQNRDLALNNVPEKYRNDVISTFLTYQRIVQELKQQNYGQKPLKSELEFVRDVDDLSKELVSENLFDAYIVTPFYSCIELLNKSHLNLAVFQTKWRGVLWAEILRWTCLIVIVTSFMSLLLTLFGSNYPIELKVIAMSFTITMLYLIFVQRLNEERYLTPLLPLALVSLFVVVDRFIGTKKRANLSKSSFE